MSFRSVACLSSRRFSRLGAAIGSLGLSLGPSIVLGQSWDVETSTFQRAEVESNRSLGGEPDGAVYGGAAGFRLNASTATERGGFDISSSLAGDIFTGPGSVDESIDLDSSVEANLDRSFGRSAVGLGVSASAQPTSFAQFFDTGVTNEDANQVNFAADGTVSHQISGRNSVSVSAAASTQRFFDGDTSLEPTNEVSAETAWSYSVTPLTQTSVGGGVTGVRIDGSDVERISYDAFAGLSGQASARLSYNVRAGASFSETSRTGLDDTNDVNFNGSLGVTYEMPLLTTSFSASQGVEPSSGGELQNQSSFSLNLAYGLSDHSQVALGAGYVFQTSADGFEDFDSERQSLVVSPSYELGLSERWGMSLGYDFRYSDVSEEDLETSHRVFLELRQNFFIVP